MGNAFDKALEEVREFNAAVDAEIHDAALKISETRQKKNVSLARLFEETATPDGTEQTNEKNHSVIEAKTSYFVG